MKYTVIIVIYLISVLPSYACLSASQNRIFPIGTCPSGLVVVELQLQRSEYYDKVNKTESMDPGWSGKSFFKIYDDNYKVVHEELIQEIEMFLSIFMTVSLHKYLRRDCKRLTNCLILQ